MVDTIASDLNSRILAGNGDIIPGDTTTTETINFGESFSGQFEADGDVDFIAFDIEAGQTVEINPEFIGGADIYSVVDADGNVLVDNLIPAPVAGSTSLVPSPASIFFTSETTGTFFIRAEQSGIFLDEEDYSFTLALLPEDEHGDTLSTATDITGETGLISSALVTQEDLDFFTHDFEAGQRITLTFEDDLPGFDGVPGGAAIPSSLEIEITDPDGNVINVERSFTPSLTLEFDAPIDGTYGIEIGSQEDLNGSLLPGFQTPYAFTVDDGTAPDDITIFNGTDSDDVILGTTGDDDIFGLDGNDTLRGRDGEDFIQGGNGNDTLFGGGDADSLFGQNGNDTLNGGGGNDFLTGGNGRDTLNGGAGADDLFGNGGSDVIRGGGGQDFINGGGGNDQLFGGGGSDNLVGGNGNDTLNAGRGNDLLTGNDGNDTFVFREGSGFDRVTDFEAGQDRIDLSGFDFDNFNDLNLVEQNGNVFVFIDENTSIELTGVESVSDLSADDFVL